MATVVDSDDPDGAIADDSVAGAAGDDLEDAEDSLDDGSEVDGGTGTVADGILDIQAGVFTNLANS